jgi:hypothetical protein
MIAYKLFRLKANGSITSLFANKSRELPIGEWMDAECHPTKDLKVRPYWHCTSELSAPHLSKKGRVWCMVEMDGYVDMARPKSQGGKWYLANRIRIIGRSLSSDVVVPISNTIKL